MQTLCRDCVFAQKLGNVQFGCAAGRLEKYKKNNVDIDNGYDANGQDFSVINGCCVYARRSKWAAGQQNNVEKLIERVNKEIGQFCNVAIYTDQNTTDKDLLKTIDSLSGNTKDNIYRIVLINSGGNKFQHILKNSGYAWKIFTPTMDTHTKDELYDMAQKQFKDTGTGLHNVMYYVKIDAGKTVPAKLIDNCKETVVDKCQPLILITFNDGCMIYRKLHEKLTGNGNPETGTTFEEEIVKFAKENNEEHTIWQT